MGMQHDALFPLKVFVLYTSLIFLRGLHQYTSNHG